MRFHEQKFAQEYDKRLTEEKYPGILLDSVEKELKGVNTIIDVGAGSGFFAIPLAKMGYKIIAIEPSHEMIKIFKSKISNKFSENINIQQIEWENWKGNEKEGLISIHSLYPMKDHRKAIEKIIKYGKKRIIIIKKENSGTLTDIIKKHFNIDHIKNNINALLCQILDDNNINYNKKEIIQERESRFLDIQDKAEYYCNYLKLEEINIDSIKKILKNVTKNIDGFHSYVSIYHDYMYCF